jgi:hypothetical protein
MDVNIALFIENITFQKSKNLKAKKHYYHSLKGTDRKKQAGAIGQFLCIGAVYQIRSSILKGK